MNNYQIFDSNSFQIHREKSLKKWPEGSFLKKIASDDLIDRTKLLKPNFNLAIDYGSNSGELSDLLLESGKVNEIINVEFVKGFAENFKKKTITLF